MKSAHDPGKRVASLIDDEKKHRLGEHRRHVGYSRWRFAFRRLKSGSLMVSDVEGQHFRIS